jgi:hypothetical protein
MLTGLRYLPAALVAVGTLATAPACATYGPGYRTGGYVYDQGYSRQTERLAYDNGFREGVEAGEKDGRRNRRYEPSRHDDWRDADDGYRRGYGDREFYRRAFRSGFEAGYARGYGRYGYEYGYGYRR